MKSIFKSIYNGILTLLTPFAWILGMAVGGVVLLFVLIGYGFYALFLFFTGRSFDSLLPEDKLINDLKRNNKNKLKERVQEPAPIDNDKYTNYSTGDYLISLDDNKKEEENKDELPY